LKGGSSCRLFLLLQWVAYGDAGTPDNKKDPLEAGLFHP
jgi:hypothetical protein